MPCARSAKNARSASAIAKRERAHRLAPRREQRARAQTAAERGEPVGSLAQARRGGAEPRGRHRGALELAANASGRGGEPAAVIRHARVELREPAPREAEPRARVNDPREQLLARGDDQLGRVGRRGGGVADEVADGLVRRMADRAHDRLRAGGDGAAEPLVVERGEVLQRAAAARDQDHVHARLAHQTGERGDDLARRGLALDRGRAREDLGRRKARVNRSDDVAEAVRAVARDHAHRAWKGGQRPQARAVAQALRRQLRDQLGAAPQQLAVARRA